MENEKITEYNLEYKGVICTGVKWTYPETNIFYFTKDGKEYEFMPIKRVSAVSDTDYIRRVIEEQFLPWWKDDQIKDLKHRAEVVERAVRNAATRLKCRGGLGKGFCRVDKCNYYHCNNDNGCVKAHLEQAEKELAEEGKDD